MKRKQRSMEIAHDFNNDAPDVETVNRLLKAATDQGAWTVFCRTLEIHSTSDVFIDNWFEECRTKDGHVVLRKSLNLRPVIDRH